MQSTDWGQQHSEALRELLESGLSYLRIAGAINAKFNTAYSRSAVIGRARRMGLAGQSRSGDGPEEGLPSPPGAKATRLHKLRKRRTSKIRRLKLRRIEIVPRHLSLIDLEGGDCRYPYGGDEEGEAITFCGHPQRQGTSYCVAHFHLTRGPLALPERAAGPVSLRLVKAA